MPRERERKRKPRRQCAALPLAESGGATLVMLVTSRETRRWVLPKGWAEKRLALHEAAAKEAFEEGGIVGATAAEAVGSYRYRKRLPGGRSAPCRVSVFPLRVERLLDDWPERRERERRWFTLVDAAAAVEEADLAALLLRQVPPED
jgi:8-oxo-dGTP pyrophosphatase MutT (NUDIX family)